MLAEAKRLLEHSKRYDRQGESACRFNYVNLKRSNPAHTVFFTLIDQIANTLHLKPIYPRLSEYVVGDFCEEHVDTIPGIRKAVSVRFDEGKSHLRVGAQFLEEGLGRINVFNPKTPHEVIPITSGNRIVLVFWLTDKESINE